EHDLARLAQVAGQPCAVGAGALHAPGLDLAEPPRPRQQVSVAGWVVGMLTVSRRRPSWSLAWATWTSPWVSTPTVTRVGWTCAMVVMAISLRLRAWGGWHAPAGWADSTAMGLWAQASIRSRLLGWRCEAVAAASSRQIRSRARSRWTAGVRPLPRPPETSSQWTLARVAEVTWRVTGVSYHPGHVSR